MVCDRCIMVVRNEFEKLNIPIDHVILGEVQTTNRISAEERSSVEQSLQPLGFELIDDKRDVVVNQIKSIIVEYVHRNDALLKSNLSKILSERLHHDYSFLSNLFSEIEHTTIEKFYIVQKVERVKELLIYDELSLSQIADALQYSSVAYLSNQFKKITGSTPSEYKKQQSPQRISLDKL